VIYGTLLIKKCTNEPNLFPLSFIHISTYIFCFYSIDKVDKRPIIVHLNLEIIKYFTLDTHTLAVAVNDSNIELDQVITVQVVARVVDVDGACCASDKREAEPPIFRVAAAT